MRRGIFIDALEYVKNILQISSIGTPFEMQKAGELHHLVQRNKKKNFRYRENGKETFGPKVIESTEEFSFCYNFVVKNHESKKRCGMNLIKNNEEVFEIIKKSSRCSLIATPDIQRKYIKGSFMKKEIERKEYRKIFDSVCELYGLPTEN